MLWGDQCRYGVKRDKTFIFKKFRLKWKNGETYLTTPKSRALSSIKEIYDFAKIDGIKIRFVEDVLFILFFSFSLTIISLNWKLLFRHGCFTPQFTKLLRTTISQMTLRNYSYQYQDSKLFTTIYPFFTF